MSMLSLEPLKERISAWSSRFSKSTMIIPVFSSFARMRTEFFYPDSPQKIRRLQFFRLGGIGLLIVAFAYGITTFLFDESPLPKQEEEVKVTPTSVETAPKKVNLEQAFRLNIENALNTLADRLTTLEFRVLGPLEGAHPLNENHLDGNPLEGRPLEGHPQGAEAGPQPQAQPQPLNSDLSKDQFTNELHNKIAHLEEQVAMNTNNSLPPQPHYPGGGQGEEEGQGSLIQKVSLGLTENPNLKLPKTVDTTIPAGAFAKTVLLSGLDASSA